MENEGHRNDSYSRNWMDTKAPDEMKRYVWKERDNFIFSKHLPVLADELTA